MLNVKKDRWTLVQSNDGNCFPSFDKDVFVIIESDVVYDDEEDYVPIIVRSRLTKDFRWMVIDAGPFDDTFVLQSETVVAWRYC